MIDTNIKGLLYVTRMWCRMVKRNRGHVISLGRWRDISPIPMARVLRQQGGREGHQRGLRLDLMGTAVR